MFRCVPGPPDAAAIVVNLAGDGTATSPNQCQSVSNPVGLAGGEIKVRREWREGWMAAAQYSYQHARYLNDDGTLREVPNSPQHLASVKAAAPLLGRVLVLGLYNATSSQYSLPVSPEFTQDLILQSGRTLLARVSASFQSAM